MQGAGGFIGIVCGLKSEAAATRAIIRDDARIRIGVSGADARRAEEIAKGFCGKGAKAILSVGVSGGLDPTLKPGDLVIGDAVVDSGGSVYRSDRDLLNALRFDPLRTGRLFGADRIISSAEAKAALFQDHQACAVDMESHGCARAAAQAGVPFLAIRAIADPADRALPPAALGAVAPDGSTRIFKTLAAAMRDPKQFPELMKLGADSAMATKAMRRTLGPLFQQLFASLKL